MPEITAPPKGILFLLWPFKGEPCYPQIEGDLSEEFQQRESEYGLAAARRWYCREVCRNLGSLIWRWITIPVIILPFFCIALGTSLLNPGIGSMYLHGHPSNWEISRLLFASFLNSSIIGLSLGIFCSRILRGHERMVRLAFGAYQLGFLAVMFHLMGIKILSNSPEMRFFLIGLRYLKPILTFAFMWTGSIWIERRRNRRNSAA
jgi:hypothetical protein